MKPVDYPATKGENDGNLHHDIRGTRARIHGVKNDKNTEETRKIDPTRSIALFTDGANARTCPECLYSVQDTGFRGFVISPWSSWPRQSVAPPRLKTSEGITD